MKVNVYNHRVVITQMNNSERAIVERECKIVYKRFNGIKVLTEKVYNFFDKEDMSFPRGLLYHIADKLEEELGEDVDADFFTTPKTHTCSYFPKNQRELWDNQVTLQKAIQEDPDGMGFISSATGTGKTEMMKIVTYDKKVRTLIIVPTQVIRDATAEAIAADIGVNKVSTVLPKSDEMTLESFRGNRRKIALSDDFDEEIYNTPEKRTLYNKGFRKVGNNFRKVEKPQDKPSFKVKNKKLHDVYVVCHGSLKNMSQELLDSIEMVIVDEADRMSDDELVFLDNAQNCYYRYFFSATMWRDRKEDMRRLIAYASTKVIFEELPSESIALKRIASVKYEQIHSPKPLESIDTLIWDKKGNMKVIKEKDIDVIFKLGITCNESRNAAITELAHDKFLDGGRVLISVWEETHCADLEERIKTKYPNAKVYSYFSKQDKEIKKNIIDLTKTSDEPFIVIGTWAIGVGADTKVVDTVIIGDSRKSTNRFVQINGRGIRQDGGDKVLEIFDFYDWFNDTLKKHSLERKRTFQNYYKGEDSFTEKKFAKVGAKLKRG
jgi:superfamily II DNA or RNA helicase